jgi:hypothetical protein
MKIHALQTGQVTGAAHRHFMPGGRMPWTGPEGPRATLERILAHCGRFPTVYLPSHDRESAARLAGSITVEA